MRSDADKNRGLYRKYEINRTDGSSRPGGRHDGCAYFVLDLVHDQFSGPALLAYADACEKQFPQLAEDLRRSVGGGMPTVREIMDASETKPAPPATPTTLCWRCDKAATHWFSYSDGEPSRPYCGDRDCGPVSMWSLPYGTMIQPIKR